MTHRHGPYQLKTSLLTGPFRAVPKSVLQLTKLDHRFSAQTVHGRARHIESTSETWGSYPNTCMWLLDFIHAVLRATKVAYHISSCKFRRYRFSMKQYIAAAAHTLKACTLCSDSFERFIVLLVTHIPPNSDTKTVHVSSAKKIKHKKQ